MKIGYPRRFFSFEGCPEAAEASAATSMGMILAAKGDKTLNCIKEAPARRFWTAPKPAESSSPSFSASSVILSEAKDLETKEPDTSVTSFPQDDIANVILNEAKDLKETPIEPEDVPIEPSVIAAQEEEGPNVFDEYTQEEIDKAKERKKERKPRPRPKFTWFKHIQNSISKGMGEIFDDMGSEEV